jgi:hypothetical protein
MAAGASEDEIVGVLLAIVPVAGLGRVVSATPDLATALGYDISAALGKLNDHLGFGSSWRPLRLRPSGADVHPRPRIHFRCEPWMQGLAAASFGMSWRIPQLMSGRPEEPSERLPVTGRGGRGPAPA